MSEKKQTIHRANYTHDPFYRAARKTAQDKTISYDALGMMNYLLSKPDDWHIQPKDLERHVCGRDKVYKILRELIAAKYVERIIHRDAKGRTVEVEYILHELKHPLPENPYLDKPDMDNQHITYEREEHTRESTLSAANAAQDETPEPNKNPGWNKLVESVTKHLFQGATKGSAYKRIGMACSELRTISPGVTDEQLASDVQSFASWWVEHYPDTSAPRDPSKLSEHWQAWRNANNGNTSGLTPYQIRAAEYLKKCPVRLFEG